jgi:Ferritin-like domain
MQDSRPREAGLPPDGAMAELSQDSHARRRFLKLAGGTGAAGAFGLLLAACGGSSSGDAATAAAPKPSRAAFVPAQFGKGDLGIVNYALTLEYLETAFYADVAKSGILKGAQLAVAQKFGQEEADHVKALKAVAKSLGKPAAKPMFDFSSVLKGGKMKVLTTAAAVENLGAAAYLAAAPHIKAPEILAAALTIHSVEARHAAALNQLLGKSPTPDGAFAKPAQPADVLKTAMPFIKS